MHIVIAGSSGFLGSALSQSLSERHEVTRLVRRSPKGDDESRWDPDAGSIDSQLIATADVIINLAGSPTAGNPHSRRWARDLEQSRVTTTRLLADTIAAVATDAAPPAFLAGNGISFYGDHGAAPLTEDADSLGDALLTRVTRVWQAAADPAVGAGARVAVLRTAPVLDRASAPLGPLARLFSLGLGGRLGSGRQYFPVISLRDWVAAVSFVAEHPELAGPVNLCCPTTPTNAEFTQALAQQLHRPAVCAVPGPLIAVAAGAMAPELLGSMNTIPQALLSAGFDFHDRDVDAVLAAGLASRRG